MMREALKLAALHTLRGVLLKFVLPVVVVIVLVGVENLSLFALIYLSRSTR